MNSPGNSGLSVWIELGLTEGSGVGAGLGSMEAVGAGPGVASGSGVAAKVGVGETEGSIASRTSPVTGAVGFEVGVLLSAIATGS